MAVGEHSAAASAAGYLYQVRWALLNLLLEAPTRPDQVLCLEMHDDVSWEGLDGTAQELLQTKLHAKTTAGLGDKDTDIWKTLYIWLSRGDATDPNGPDLALVTSSTAPEGTAAYACGPTRAPATYRPRSPPSHPQPPTRSRPRPRKAAQRSSSSVRRSGRRF